MLSKNELKERYKQLSESFQIRNEKNEIKFFRTYLEKSFHNLEVAGILEILSSNPKKKELFGIRSEEIYSDWVIIASYYAMYMAATSALARLGLKTTTHGATVIGLEYKYCIEQNLLPRKYIEMIRNAHFNREDIQKLDDAMKKRIAVQYTVTESYSYRESNKILKDARGFVNKISDIISE